MSGEDQQERKFGVVAEVEGYGKQLVLLDLPFGRLIDEIVVFYNSNPRLREKLRKQYSEHLKHRRKKS